MLTCDRYLTPQGLDEALALLERYRGACRVVAGATDTLPAVREGRWGDLHVETVIDIGGVVELGGVELRNGRLRIGATTPVQRCLDLPLLREQAPALPHCAVWFADDQLRETATVGGNLVNASPAADLTPPLIAMDADVRLARSVEGRRQERVMKLAEFVTGPASTALEEGELLLGVECDALAGYGGAFEKVGHRRSLVISTVCVAAFVRPDAAGKRIEDVRLAIGAVGPVPERLEDSESMLRGRPVDAVRIREAAGLAAGRIRSRTRQEYRREVLVKLVERATIDALADAGVICNEGAQAQETRHVLS